LWSCEKKTDKIKVVNEILQKNMHKNIHKKKYIDNLSQDKDLLKKLKSNIHKN